MFYHNKPFVSGVPVGIILTPYTIKVDNVWFGECAQETVCVVIRGDEETGVTKPHLYDQGIFLLREYEEGYTVSNAEAGIFIKNPPNDRLYAFAPHESFTSFDGKTTSSLKRALQGKLNNIATAGGNNENLNVGKVGKNYFETYELNMKEKELSEK